MDAHALVSMCTCHVCTEDYEAKAAYTIQPLIFEELNFRFFRKFGETAKFMHHKNFPKNCYKLLLVALGGLCQAPLAFCLRKSHHHPYLLPTLV